MLKDKFLIKGLAGKKTLKGKIAVAGAKNAVLPALAASLLFKDKFCISNVPEISDARHMATLLQNLDAKITKKTKKTFCIETKNIKKKEIDTEISNELRASIILTGPLLARFGEVSFSHPGGCIIGKRPVDIFIDGYKKMGAKVTQKNGKYNIKTKDKKLKGAKIFFDKISVTGTETLMLAGVLAKGKTVLENAAMEPEIKHLAEFLNSCGAKIKGAGTSTIEITGGILLQAKGKMYKTLPDRIEAGSFLILGALSADNLEITNCIPEHINSLIELLRQSGLSIKTEKNKILIKNNSKTKNNVFKNVDVQTHEYPGFATDLQAPMCVFLTQTKGESKIHETIFEGRLNHTGDLVRMGANITMWNPHQATIKGPTTLRGKELEGPDLRAGLAYVIAAVIAKGDSVVNNVHYIDRGYEKIEERLRDIGVNIKRIKS
ncbi:MAG: UDP-N-acetylglucosamine 1-carboxyvinyltransferase [Candidatus Paceibacteria bacterium]